MVIALYIRQSKFSNQSESIENQIAFCNEYCKNYFPNAEICTYIDEGYSAKNIERPNFQKMLDDIIPKKIKFIITYKLDRLCRNTKDFVNLVDMFELYGVNFTSVKENFDLGSTTGKMIALMYSMFSQLERESISERIRDNMYESAKSGRWLGGPSPLGYKFLKAEENGKITCHLQIDNSSIHTVKYIYESFLRLKSLTQVRNLAYKNGILGPKGNHLDLSTISNILRSPIYVKSSPSVVDFFKNKNIDTFGEPNYKSGFLTYGKKSLFNDKPIAAVSKHDAIIDCHTWLKVQSILQENKNKFPRQGTGRTALLSGILKCKICDSNMRISYKKNKSTNKEHSYYICGRKKKFGKTACSCSNIPTNYIDKLILDSISDIDLDRIVDIYENNNLLSYTINTDQTELNVISKNIKNKSAKMKILSNRLCLTNNQIVLDSIIHDMENIANDIDDLKVKQNKLKNKINNVSQDDVNNANYCINKFNTFLNNESLECKREFISLIIDKVIWDSSMNSIDIIFKNI